MLEMLPAEKRKILNEYPWILEAITASKKNPDFIKSLRPFTSELLKRGLTKEEILIIAALGSEENYKNRDAAYEHFRRFARRLGLELATTEQKIEWIKNASPQKFLKVLSIGNELLQGKTDLIYWEYNIHKAIVINKTAGITVLDPPEEAQEQFFVFFRLMQEAISLHNYKIWAAKLYIAIVFAHLFPDGNGRIARNAYYTLRWNGVLPKDSAIHRHEIIGKICSYFNRNSIVALLQKEGLPIKDYSEAETYCAEYREIPPKSGEAAKLKYIACKHVLQKHGAWNTSQQQIVYGTWNDEMRTQFNHEYQNVRVQWYWTALYLVEKNYLAAIRALDKALLLSEAS